MRTVYALPFAFETGDDVFIQGTGTGLAYLCALVTLGAVGYALVFRPRPDMN